MTFSSQVILSIFFLYVVIISDKIFSIISCALQKKIMNSVYFKHIFIFINIFLFTFVLGWYTEFSIDSAKKSYIKENFNNKMKISNLQGLSVLDLYSEEIKIIFKYLGYSAIIYFIFLFTTKCEFNYLILFFILIIILFVLFLMRTYSKKNEDYITVTDFKLLDYISEEEKNKKILSYQEFLNTKNYSDEDKLYKLLKFKKNIEFQNIEFYLFSISLIILVLGFVVYLNRQYKEHYSEWNTLIFIFGKNICENYKK